MDGSDSDPSPCDRHQPELGRAAAETVYDSVPIPMGWGLSGYLESVSRRRGRGAV